MSPEEQAAYDEALKRIEECRRNNLTSLVLCRMNLTALPPEIGQLKTLEQLYLFRNQLTALPPEIGQFPALEWLDLSDNQLTELPPEIGQLTKLTRLFLHGNPGLGLPTEVLGPTGYEVAVVQKPAEPKSPREILDYYFATRGQAGKALRELRLIVVGPPKAGKTTLIRRLKGENLNKNEPETHSIHISPMEFTCNDGPMHTRVWDFGGQHVLHAMHEFFLSRRCLYLLVLEQRTERTEKEAKYWLRLIRSYAGDAPVVIALNQSRGVARPLARTTLERDYGTILDVVATECLSDAECPGASATIETLRTALTKAMDGMREPRQLFPVKWAGIKKWLEEMKEPFLDYKTFAARCAKDEPNAAKQEELAALMNDLGIALNYARDPRLRDTTVLRPDWLANGIYAILRANMLTEQPLIPDGVLTAEKLGPIYKAAEQVKMLRARDYPAEKYGFLLRLMGLFRLSFPLDDEDRKHLVPGLLSPDEPKGCDEPGGAHRVQIRYDFDVVPAPLMGRFLVGLFPLLEQGKVWKRGGCLQFAGAEAKVWMDVDEKCVFATVGGHKPSREDLLVMIRETMKEMFRDYRDLTVVEHWKHKTEFVPRKTLEEFGVLKAEEDDLHVVQEAILPGEDDA